MDRVLLLNPYPFLHANYSERREYAFLQGNKVSYWLDEIHHSITVDYPVLVPGNVKVAVVRAKILKTLPIWVRWMGQSDRYEDYMQTCIAFVVRFVQVLQELNVKTVLFCTAVSHHVEISLAEIACQIAGVQQMFLYPMPFFAKPFRLLPLLQKESIQDRHIFGAQVSDRSAIVEIEAYKANYLAGEPPNLNEKFNSVEQSYSIALAQVAILGLKKIVKLVVRRKSKVQVYPVGKWVDHDCFSLLRMVRSQKAALDHYESVMQDDTTVDSMLLEDGPLPFLYAHFQPEATSFPEGGDYANHLDIVIEIRRLGYKGKILYGEHPACWSYRASIGFTRVGLHRSIEYYKRLASLNCTFVRPGYGSLHRNSKGFLPITITGSIAVERSLCGYSTCCAGLPWFKDAPGIFSLVETFGENGVFYDSERWQFSSDTGLEWFSSNISQKTLINYPGIGSGIKLESIDEQNEFLNELEILLEKTFD